MLASTRGNHNMKKKHSLLTIRNDDCVTGGETIVVDALAVAEKLRATHPHHFATLTRVPATFQRIHYERYHIYLAILFVLLHINSDCDLQKKPCAYDVSDATYPLKWT